MKCHYQNTVLDPKFKSPECQAGYHWFRLENYFVKANKNHSRDMILCDAHAGWWNDNHPFGPHAIPIPTLQLNQNGGQ